MLLKIYIVFLACKYTSLPAKNCRESLCFYPNLNDLFGITYF